MKWLLLDDPAEHGSTMHENISAGLRTYKQDVKVACKLDEAIELLQADVFE
jgi:hypothetical protein